MIVALMGYRTTGKTSIGRRLARRLGWPWLDTDKEIVRRAGASIAELFGQGRQAEFRDLEAAVIRDVDTTVDQVVSLGGGAVLRPDSRQIIATWDHVIWLVADPATIVRRMQRDPHSRLNRPQLTGLDLDQEVRTTLAQREPLYSQLATLSLDTSAGDRNAIVAQIAAAIGH